MSEQIVTKRRRTSFLDSSLRLDGIIAILEALRGGELTAARLLVDSNIRFRKSFYNYTRYCKDKQFVTSNPGICKTPNRWEGRTCIHYSITEKGWRFLDLVK